MTQGSRLATTRHGRVLIAELTNPPRNFFDERMALELEALVRRVDGDPEIGAVVLTGRERWVTHYSVPELLRAARSAPFPYRYGVARATAPLTTVLARSGPLSRALRHTRLRDTLLADGIYRTFRRMSRSEKVYVAAINGIALGMGMILTLACDLRLMADGDDFEMGFIETGVSMLAGVSGTQRLVRMVGESRAAELLLEGRRLRPREAADLGLVHRVAPADQLQDEALALAQRVGSRSPAVNREIKRMVYDAGSRPIGRALRMEAASLVATTSAPRAARDLEAYLRTLPERPTDRQILDVWDEALPAS